MNRKVRLAWKRPGRPWRLGVNGRNLSHEHVQFSERFNGTLRVSHSIGGNNVARVEMDANKSIGSE